MFWWKDHPFLYIFTGLFNFLCVFLSYRYFGFDTAFYFSIFETIFIWVVFFLYTKIFSPSLLLFITLLGICWAIFFPNIGRAVADQNTLNLFIFLFACMVAFLMEVYRRRENKK